MTGTPPSAIHKVLGYWMGSRPSNEGEFSSTDAINLRIACRIDSIVHQRLKVKRRAKAVAASKSNTAPTAPTEDKTPPAETLQLSLQKLRLANVHTLSDTTTQRLTFTGLPREIRDHIYSFVRPAPVNIQDPRQRRSQHPLSKVSRQIEVEYREYYFSNAVFMQDTRIYPPSRFPAYIDYESGKAIQRVRATWVKWAAELEDQDAGRLRHLMFYGDQAVVRIELSANPARAVVSVKPKGTDWELGVGGSRSGVFSPVFLRCLQAAMDDMLVGVKDGRFSKVEIGRIGRWAMQQQRQEPASAYYQRAGLRDYSRPSSSSGSALTLRRTPQVDQLRSPRLRSSSVDSPPRRRTTPERSPSPRASPLPRRTSHRRANSAFWALQPPHPALQTSKRTHAAIQYVIEEFLRHPNNFTPVLEEENAQMSELGGGRASNGGARTGGPVPVPSGTPTGIRTPRDIMRDRNTREARRQEEQKAEEARRLAEDRRRSAERRAATVGGGAPRFSQASSQYAPDPAAQQGGFDGAADRRSGNRGSVSGADVLGDPVGRTQEYSSGKAQEYPTGRTRASSGSQAQPTSSGARRTQHAQATPRQLSGPASAGAASSQAQQPAAESSQRATSSSFPHAFERWETLSSHWEGLTSYWLHKLESNTEEIKNAIPNAATLNRQITDLSAAGANLFHAVVELQRLRASSERKFQRWFFETRGDTERQQEMQAQTERQMRLERSAREEAATKRAEAEEAAAIARREVSEMRRELMISKDEARRAWEELGRRNQEALDIAEALKSGRVALVAGVQVMPYNAYPSRTGSASQRPTTRDGQLQYGSVAGASSAGAAGLASPGDDAEYYRERPSSTNTDPFTEQQQPPPMDHDSDKPSLAAGTYRPYPVGEDPRMAQPSAAAAMGVQPPTASSPETQRFYQHGPAETFLHSPPGSSSGGGPVAPAQAAPPRREDVLSEASYVDTLSEDDTEYAIDAGGNVRHDEQGRPIVFQRRRGQSEGESDDQYDEEAIRHERELAARYGRGQQQQQQAYAHSVSQSAAPPESYYPSTQQPLPEAPSGPTTSAQAMATYTPTTGGPPGGPDYEGSGYGGWDAVQTTRHHHPTRLSDVLEEEEERSSRRTGGD
ncbi:hypothetical protein B0A55_04710 [Friedmanniomyces simplex]|uniref:Uncharacterized protein n=1 Tax=Friedmanniomyces simplex TaxID=329884 RepID=A0A4U0XFI8_9PEZI|nr:hypothetical protein B0A55_04710 [Friedmanniomyces simplex]